MVPVVPLYSTQQ